MAETESATPQLAGPTGPGPALLALVACQIGLHACTQGARLAAPLQALQQGAGAAAVGVLMALFALLPALPALPAGRLADRWGFHRPVRLAAGLSLAGALAAALGSDSGGVYVAAALCGAGSGFGMIAVQRSAGRMARSAAGRITVFSWVALAPAVANFTGPLLAEGLIDHLGFRAAFLALAVLPAATLLLSAGVPHEAPVAPVAAATRPPAWSLLAAPAFRRLLFINRLVSTSWDVFSLALPLVGHQRGLSASALGTVLAAYAVAAMAVRLLIPLLAHCLSRRLMMSGALALVAGVFVLYPGLQMVWAMALGAALLGLALGAIQPAILASVHDAAPPLFWGMAMALALGAWRSGQPGAGSPEIERNRD